MKSSFHFENALFSWHEAHNCTLKSAKKDVSGEKNIATLFAVCATCYVFLSFRMMIFNNKQLSRTVSLRSQLSMHVVAALIRVKVSCQAHRLFDTPIANLRIEISKMISIVEIGFALRNVSCLI